MSGPLKVSSLGAYRRVNALRAIGWTLQAISDQTGLSRMSLEAIVRRPRVTMTRTLSDRIAAAYDALSMIPGPSAVTRKRATASGHAPPLAWVDIDDPDEQPDCGAKPTARGVDLDEWLFLVRGGEEPERAARRLGVSIYAIQQQARRKDRPEVLAIAEPVAARVKYARELERKSA